MLVYMQKLHIKNDSAGRTRLLEPLQTKRKNSAEADFFSKSQQIVECINDWLETLDARLAVDT